MTAPVEAVLFDWGGTLSRYEQPDLLDLWRAAAEHLDAPRADELTRRLLAVEAERWRQTQTTQRSCTLAAVLAAASEAVGLDVAEAVIEEAASRHLDAWTPHIRHDPAAGATLRALRERGLRLGLLSNTMWPRAFHDRFLERDGLLELLDVRLYTSEMERVKPHPSAFEAAVAALAVADPRAVVHVGDRPLDDIAGAQDAGLRTVLRRGSPVPAADVTPDAEIDRLPELIAIIDAWRDAAGAPPA